MVASFDTLHENDYCYRLEPATQRPASAATDNVKRVTSEALLGARKELLIVHAGREYRLRLTQNGKLILTA